MIKNNNNNNINNHNHKYNHNKNNNNHNIIILLVWRSSKRLPSTFEGLVIAYGFWQG